MARVAAPLLTTQSAAEKNVNTTSKDASYLSRFLEDAPAPKPKGHTRSASGDKVINMTSPTKETALLRASATQASRSKSNMDVSRSRNSGSSPAT